MINIGAPSFALVTPRCECCSEQGALYFSTCTNCKAIVLVCDERETVFFDLKKLFNGSFSDLDDPTCLCPNCNTTHVSQFQNSSAEEIQALGYSKDDYC